jgi:hypothetical protein
MSAERDKQIQSVSADPLANLSIEELEQRLEMQMLLFNVGQDSTCGSFSCGSYNGGCTVKASCGTFL